MTTFQLMNEYRYWAYKSAWSMDGLPAMKRGLEVGRRDQVQPIKKMVGRSASPGYINRYRRGYYTLEEVLVIGLMCIFLGWLAGKYGRAAVETCVDSLPRDLKVLTSFSSIGG